MFPGRTLVVVAAHALLATACHHDRSGAPAASSSPVGSAPVPGFTVPRALAPLKWAPYRDVGNLGVPAGCALRLPVQSAALPAGSVRFITAAGASGELLLAVDEDGDGVVDRDGVLDATGTIGHPLPWTQLDEPPVFAGSVTGFLAFDAEDTGNGSRRGMMWRDPGRAEPLLEGDRLDVVDAACAGATCAVLSTLASASASAGASVLVGDSHDPSSRWKRTDLPGGDKAFTPFSIVRVSNGVAWVALAAPGAIEVSRIEAGRAASVGRLEAPFGAYDVVIGDSPIAVAPGESIENHCKKDGFPVRLITPSGTVEVDGQVPPTSVFTRPLGSGFIVAWLSPVSCRHDGRDIVRAFLVGPDGKPASSTMAVSDAQGFALAAHGEAVDLWLAVGKELVWVKATCTVPPVAHTDKVDKVDKSDK